MSSSSLPLSGPFIFPIFLYVLLLLSGTIPVSAQFSVSPTRILLNNGQRTSEARVINTSDKNLEITTGTGFELIRSDSLGNITLDTNATDAEYRHSCREWLKVYPRKFVLAPHSSRLIRVLITPESNIADGEYWGRLLVGGAPVAEAGLRLNNTGKGIATEVTMRLVIDLPIIYRKGDISTGILIDTVTVRNAGNGNLDIRVDMERTGNSAYRGTLSAVLSTDEGELSRSSEQFTVEFTLRRAVSLTMPPDGSYILEVSALPEKKGSAREAVIPAEPEIERYMLTISGQSLSLKQIEE